MHICLCVRAWPPPRCKAVGDELTGLSRRRQCEAQKGAHDRRQRSRGRKNRHGQGGRTGERESAARRIDTTDTARAALQWEREKVQLQIQELAGYNRDAGIRCACCDVTAGGTPRVVTNPFDAAHTLASHSTNSPPKCRTLAWRRGFHRPNLDRATASWSRSAGPAKLPR